MLFAVVLVTTVIALSVIGDDRHDVVVCNNACATQACAFGQAVACAVANATATTAQTGACFGQATPCASECGRCSAADSPTAQRWREFDLPAEAPSALAVAPPTRFDCTTGMARPSLCNATACAHKCAGSSARATGQCFRGAFSETCDCMCASEKLSTSAWSAMAAELSTSGALYERAAAWTLSLTTSSVTGNVRLHRCTVSSDVTTAAACTEADERPTAAGVYDADFGVRGIAGWQFAPDWSPGCSSGTRASSSLRSGSRIYTTTNTYAYGSSRCTMSVYHWSSARVRDVSSFVATATVARLRFTFNLDIRLRFDGSNNVYRCGNGNMIARGDGSACGNALLVHAGQLASFGYRTGNSEPQGYGSTNEYECTAFVVRYSVARLPPLPVMTAFRCAIGQTCAAALPLVAASRAHSAIIFDLDSPLALQRRRELVCFGGNAVHREPRFRIVLGVTALCWRGEFGVPTLRCSGASSSAVPFYWTYRVVYKATCETDAWRQSGAAPAARDARVRSLDGVLGLDVAQRRVRVRDGAPSVLDQQWRVLRPHDSAVAAGACALRLYNATLVRALTTFDVERRGLLFTVEWQTCAPAGSGVGSVALYVGPPSTDNLIGTALTMNLGTDPVRSTLRVSPSAVAAAPRSSAAPRVAHIAVSASGDAALCIGAMRIHAYRRFTAPVRVDVATGVTTTWQSFGDYALALDNARVSPYWHAVSLYDTDGSARRVAANVTAHGGTDGIRLTPLSGSEGGAVVVFKVIDTSAFAHIMWRVSATLTPASGARDDAFRFRAAVVVLPSAVDPTVDGARRLQRASAGDVTDNNVALGGDETAATRAAALPTTLSAIVPALASPYVATVAIVVAFTNYTASSGTWLLLTNLSIGGVGTFVPPATVVSAAADTQAATVAFSRVTSASVGVLVDGTPVDGPIIGDGELPVIVEVTLTRAPTTTLFAVGNVTLGGILDVRVQIGALISLSTGSVTDVLRVVPNITDAYVEGRFDDVRVVYVDDSNDGDGSAPRACLPTISFEQHFDDSGAFVVSMHVRAAYCPTANAAIGVTIVLLVLCVLAVAAAIGAFAHRRRRRHRHQQRMVTTAAPVRTRRQATSPPHSPRRPRDVGDDDAPRVALEYGSVDVSAAGDRQQRASSSLPRAHPPLPTTPPPAHGGAHQYVAIRTPQAYGDVHRGVVAAPKTTDAAAHYDSTALEAEEAAVYAALQEKRAAAAAARLTATNTTAR